MYLQSVVSEVKLETKKTMLITLPNLESLKSWKFSLVIFHRWLFTPFWNSMVQTPAVQTMVVWWCHKCTTSHLTQWNEISWSFLKPQSHLTKMNSLNHIWTRRAVRSPRHRIHDVVGNDQAHQCHNTSSDPKRLSVFFLHFPCGNSQIVAFFGHFAEKRRFIGCWTTETLRYFPKVFSPRSDQEITRRYHQFQEKYC